MFGRPSGQEAWRKEGALSLLAGGEENLGQHDGCPLGEDCPVPFVGLSRRCVAAEKSSSSVSVW